MENSVQPTADEITRRPYVELLAMLEESNLPPGGLATVRGFAQDLGLRPGLLGLHAGCNAGFLSRELARRTGAKVVGVDISPSMAEAANLRAKQEGLADLAGYECQDTRALTFPGRTFRRRLFRRRSKTLKPTRITQPHYAATKSSSPINNAPPDS